MTHRTHRLLGRLGLAIGAAVLAVTTAPGAVASTAPLNVGVSGTLQITETAGGAPTKAVYGGQGSGPSLGPVQMRGTISVTGPASCANGFAATHVDTLTTKDGAQVLLTITEESCPIAASGSVVTFQCTGTYTVSGGTGRYASASGSGSWRGSLNLDMNAGSGSFTASYSGAISLV